MSEPFSCAPMMLERARSAGDQGGIVGRALGAEGRSIYIHYINYLTLHAEAAAEPEAGGRYTLQEEAWRFATLARLCAPY